MTALVVVDTNVLLYARDAAQPAKQPVAQDWLATLWRPFRMSLTERAAAYGTSAPAAVSRHRPRGRPRRLA